MFRSRGFGDCYVTTDSIIAMSLLENNNNNNSRLGETFFPARTTGFFRVGVETLLPGVRRGSPVAHTAQLLALLCRTVMCAPPSVMKNRTENRSLLAFFVASRSFAAKRKVPRRGREASPARGHRLLNAPPPNSRESASPLHLPMFPSAR